MEKVQELLYNNLFNVWKQITTDTEELKKELKEEIFNNGINGANTLLDWCRTDFENYNEEDNIYEELENAWDWANWYLDYLQGKETEESIINLLKN